MFPNPNQVPQLSGAMRPGLTVVEVPQSAPPDAAITALIPSPSSVTRVGSTINVEHQRLAKLLDGADTGTFEFERKDGKYVHTDQVSFTATRTDEGIDVEWFMRRVTESGCVTCEKSFHTVRHDGAFTETVTLTAYGSNRAEPPIVMGSCCAPFSDAQISFSVHCREEGSIRRVSDPERVNGSIRFVDTVSKLSGPAREEILKLFKDNYEDVLSLLKDGSQPLIQDSWLTRRYINADDACVAYNIVPLGSTGSESRTFNWRGFLTDPFTLRAHRRLVGINRDGGLSVLPCSVHPDVYGECKEMSLTNQVIHRVGTWAQVTPFDGEPPSPHNLIDLYAKMGRRLIAAGMMSAEELCTIDAPAFFQRVHEYAEAKRAKLAAEKH